MTFQALVPPKLRGRISAGVLALALLTGCSAEFGPSHSDSSPPITPTPRPSHFPFDASPVAITSDALATALLSDSDVRYSWSEDPLPEHAEHRICPDASLDVLIGSGTDSVEAHFASSQTGPTMVQILISLSRTDASLALDTFEHAISECGEWSELEGDTTQSWSTHELAFPPLGKATLSIRAATEALPLLSYKQVDWVVILRDSASGDMSVVEVYGMATSQTTPLRELEELVRKGDNKAGEELGLE